VRRVLALAIVVLAACGGGGGVHDVDDARDLLDDDGAFDTGKDAGQSFAKIADALLELGRDCVDDKGREDETCGRHLAAAAFAQVFATDALQCTQPGIDEARVGLDAYLAGGEEVPQVPVCT
jgi:hypothetical protein